MEDVTPERWLPVPGYEGFYEVSDLGRVRSLPRKKCAGRILKPRPLPHGYLQVTLSMGNIQKVIAIHRLVAAAFLGPCPEGQEVRHLDGDPANNRLGNLAYGTHAENMQDMIRHGTRKAGAQLPHAKLTEVQVAAIRASWAQGARVTDLAVCYGVSKPTISRVTRGNAYPQTGIPMRPRETCHYPGCGSLALEGRDGKGLTLVFCGEPRHNARTAARERYKLSSINGHQ